MKLIIASTKAVYSENGLSHQISSNSKIWRNTVNAVIPVAHLPHQLECKIYSPVFAKYKAGTAIKKCLTI
jgi:hypothetical protein